jgi:hypothetical protein
MAATLPEQFGNGAGTYTVTMSLKDRNDKLLAREPIIAFSWTRESGFLFIEKAVTEVLKTSWRGSLVHQVPIRSANERLRLEIELLYQKDRSLDFELVKKTAKTFSEGALAGLAPLPAASVPVLGAIGELLNAFYAGSQKKTLVEQDEIAFTGEKTIKTSKIRFTDGNGNRFDVPLVVTIETQRARLAPLKDGKFDASSLTENIIAAEFTVGDGKSVPILELMATSDHAQLKVTRPLLDSVMNGKEYGRDANNAKEKDVGFRCGALYEGFHLYLSQHDARALFWAFLRRYGDRTDRTACLGERAAELEAVNLKP